VSAPGFVGFRGNQRESERGNLDHAGTDAPTVCGSIDPSAKVLARIGFAAVLGFPLASLSQEGSGILAPEGGAEGFL
jgi:hypothetical protein